MSRPATYEHAWAAVDPKRFPFVYATPWVLIRRNGALQLAYVTRATAEGAELALRGKIWSATSRSYTKTDCRLGEIVFSWRHPPHWKTVEKKKAQLNRTRFAAENARFRRGEAA